MKKNLINIVAPAGNLESGLYAFKAGANAVYFGLPRFSARKSAVNFSMSDVRRLKGYALKKEGKIYAAINTVIAENETIAALQSINELMLAEVDGVIIQDLGMAYLIRKHFPTLSLHGSTQLAVHNKEGLAAAAKLNLKRVVLSRELSLREIENLKTHSSIVEREVFVHGALCYGFSGLCLASSVITGRSGNRGECAQICRTWFEKGKEKGFYFSSVDLDGGDLSEALYSAGVSAIKIEGRMKSAAYVYNTVAYHRSRIDGDADKAKYYRNLSALSFSRPQSLGFLKGTKNTPLTNPSYPSHTGIPGAKVVSVDRDRAVILALTRLSTRDRLMKISDSPSDEGTSLTIEGFGKNGRRQNQLNKGETGTINGCSGLHAGVTLMKTFSHDMYLKTLKKEGFLEHVHKLTLRAQITEEGLRLGTKISGVVVEKTYATVVEPSKGKKRLDDILLSRMAGFDGYCFGFDKIEAFTGHEPVNSNLFIPPSALKQIRNAFYLDVQRVLSEVVYKPTVAQTLSMLVHPLPPREKIKYPDGFPFAAEGTKWSCSQWPIIGAWRYLALPPVMLSLKETTAFLSEQIRANPDEQIAVGLSNVGHLTLAEEWKQHANVSFFIDYGIYAANTSTLIFAQQNIARLLGAYLWLEADEKQRNILEKSIKTQCGTLPNGIKFVDHPEKFPLFISRACFQRAQQSNVCDKNCSKDFSHILKQNKSLFDVRVKDCITYVFARAASTNFSDIMGALSQKK